METYEINAAIKYSYYAYKDIWEANRLTALVIAQVNSKKRLKAEDIVQFPWEEKSNDTKITREEIEQLRTEAQKFINGGGFSNQADTEKSIVSEQSKLE